MKRFIAYLLVVCLLLPLTGIPRAEAYFTDIPDDGTQQAAELLYLLGVVAGTGGTAYSPGLYFDRAALAVIGTRLSGVFDVSTYGGTVRFPDVRANHWAHRWVNAANTLGIMSGGTDGNFNPEEPMLYGHLITVLMKLLGYIDADVGYNWPQSYIGKAEALGLSKDMSFTAGQKLTRGEAARIIYNFLFTQTKEGTPGRPYITERMGVEIVQTFDRGELVIQLIKEGKVLSVLPDRTASYRQTSVASAHAHGLEFENGVYLPAAASVGVMGWDGLEGGFSPVDFAVEEPVTLVYRGDELIYIIREYEFSLLRLERFGNQTYIGKYLVKGAIDDALTGQTGWLRLDRDGNAVGFIPSKLYTYRSVTASDARSSGLVDEKGELVPVRDAETRVYGRSAEEDAVYNAVWNKIMPGEVFLLAYDPAGRLQYLYRGAARGGYGDDYLLAVLETQPVKGSDPLGAAFGAAAAGAVLYKNGCAASADMLEQWDVLMFYESAGVVEACDVRISGYHHSPRPSPSAPSELWLFDRKYELLIEATAKMDRYTMGQRWIFLLSSDGKIADVRSPGEVRETTIGLDSSGGVSIRAGMEIDLKGTVTGGRPGFGRVGHFHGTADGGILFTPVEPQNGGRGDFNLAARVLGSAPLAPWCVFYDQVGANGRAVQVLDMPVSRVPANKVLYAEIGRNGYVTAVVFDDVSGDAYVYGTVDNRTTTEYSIFGEYTYDEIGVAVNGTDTVWYLAGSVTPPLKGKIVGAAVGNSALGDGIVVALVECVRHEGLTRFDFNGGTSVKIGGKDIPLAVSEVFVPSIGLMLPLDEARSYCRSFEVYTDPMGYKARYIIGRP